MGGLIVIAALKNDKSIVLNLVNETMLHVDSPGPTSGQGVFQWLGISTPGERFASDFPNQFVDPL
jgi:hypothetical protein